MPTDVENLNHMTPPAFQAKLGTKLNQIITLINEMRTDINIINDTIDGIVAKLDADAGITDTNYAAIWGTGGSDGNAMPADISAAAVDTITS